MEDSGDPDKLLSSAHKPRGSGEKGRSGGEATFVNTRARKKYAALMKKETAMTNANKIIELLFNVKSFVLS
jgi:hypothetical protein